MPGAKLDGASVYDSCPRDGDYTAGVPTVCRCAAIHGGREETCPTSSADLRRLGDARSMLKSFVDMAVEVRHAWGMTR